MAREPTHVSLPEFSNNVEDFFEQGRRKRTAADHEAFLSSFGGWSDIDDEAFVKRVYEGRSISTRPLVEL